MNLILARIGKGYDEGPGPSALAIVVAFGVPILFCFILFLLRPKLRFQFSLSTLLAFTLTLATCFFIQTQVLSFDRLCRKWELGTTLFPKEEIHFAAHFALALLWTNAGFLAPECFRTMRGSDASFVPSRSSYLVSACAAFLGASLSLLLLFFSIMNNIQ